MRKGHFQAFDGYEQIVADIETARKYGHNYTADRIDIQPYLDRLHPARLLLRLAEIIDQTPTSKTLRFVSPDHYLPPFQAGQYLSLHLQVGRIRTSRPYSISSPPNQTGYYDLTIRRVPGGLVSNHLLDNLQLGDVLESSGPAGHFYYNPLFHEKTAVCLAGGSGITPFMSMIQEAIECGLERGFHLFYGNRRLDDAILHETLMGISQRFHNIHYYPVIENPPAGYSGLEGLITGELIRKTLGDMAGKTFYLCGPQAMYDFCLPELSRIGVSPRKIRREVYGPPLEITRDPAWPQQVSPDAVFNIKVTGHQVFSAKAGETLLTALERNGLIVPTICRSGECSQCRIKVLDGQVFEPAGALVRRSDRKYGYVHSCVTYPLSDLEILL